MPESTDATSWINQTLFESTEPIPAAITVKSYILTTEQDSDELVRQHLKQACFTDETVDSLSMPEDSTGEELNITFKQPDIYNIEVISAYR